VSQTACLDAFRQAGVAVPSDEMEALVNAAGARRQRPGRDARVDAQLLLDCLRSHLPPPPPPLPYANGDDDGHVPAGASTAAMCVSFQLRHAFECRPSVRPLVCGNDVHTRHPALSVTVRVAGRYACGGGLASLVVARRTSSARTCFGWKTTGCASPSVLCLCGVYAVC
jgi:hypothetical protein